MIYPFILRLFTLIYCIFIYIVSYYTSVCVCVLVIYYLPDVLVGIKCCGHWPQQTVAAEGHKRGY